ncbi:hypothetical protein [Acinetobacter baumannii]|uniref:hypothetical protein n=1 Tax=Acinetobacter baumannii TaxID=470 RepID=UPI0018FF446A|nr:hypothetical protein [Acinetobacter baumannii]MBJ9578039.1 hypothetical protein [Acinetobacter baumannii]
MFDVNKEREAFEAWLIKKFDLPPKSFSLDFNDGVYDSIPTQARWEAWKERAKAQAVPFTHTHSVTLTCAELKEAFDFGAPDGEKDQFQLETEMFIKWLDDGYDGAGYYCWYADLPEEGCIKLGESESGAEG